MYQPYQMQYGGFQQPFAPSLPAQQPMQQQSFAPQTGIMGHMVGSHEEIKPQDVPMNGAAAYFPTQDGSVIFAKAWNPDGSITTVRYTPEIENKPDDVQTPTLFDIVDQLNDIEDLLKADKKPATAKRTTKKVTEDDASD